MTPGKKYCRPIADIFGKPLINLGQLSLVDQKALPYRIVESPECGFVKFVVPVLKKISVKKIGPC